MKKIDERKSGTQPVPGGRNQNDYPAHERPCLAHYCPELGTITESVHDSHGARWFCRHHYAERNNPQKWPEISERLHAQPRPEPVDPAGAYAGWTREQCQAEIKEILSDCRGGFIAGTWQHIAGNTAMDPKAWAHKLKAREEAGEDLSIMQRQNWRDALGV